MAIAGVGVVFNRWEPGSGSSGTWQAIAEITSIGGPGMSRDVIDTTALDTLGGYRTFIAGFRNPGTLSLTMNFTNAGYNAMKTDFEDDDAQVYQVILPDTEQTTLEFEALVTELPLDIPTDDKVTCAITLQISGPVDVGIGGSA